MKAKNIYLNNYEGKKRAIANLQFAIEDIHPWYLSCPFRAHGASHFNFNNWVLKETFDEACRAILNSTAEIRFYQMDDTPELSDDEVTKHLSKLV